MFVRIIITGDVHKNVHNNHFNTQIYVHLYCNAVYNCLSGSTCGFPFTILVRSVWEIHPMYINVLRACVQLVFRTLH